MSEGHYKVGQRVRFHAENVATDTLGVYPSDAARVGQVGVVEQSGHCPRVRMSDGYLLTGWDNTRYAAEPTAFVLLEDAGEATGGIYQTRHADLAAAIQWMQDNGIQGSFKVLHVTEGETLTATRETKTVVTVNA